MAYYYVKSGGTATGDGGRYATLQTGSFASLGASGYYDGLEALNSTPATAVSSGDIVLVSDASNKTDTSVTFTFVDLDSTPNAIVSVSDTNCDQYSAGAIEESTTSVMYFYGAGSYHGMVFKHSGLLQLAEAAAKVRFEDCEFYSDSQFNTASTSDGGRWEFINCTFRPQSTTFCGFNVGNGMKVHIEGGSMIPATTHTHFITNSGANGGAQYEVYGCDLSNVSGAIIGNVGNSTGDDAHQFYFEGCKINGSSTYFEESILPHGIEALFVNCAATSAAAEYQYYYINRYGTVEDQDDSGIHRDESTAFPSGTKASLKITTGINGTSLGMPLSFKSPTRFVDLSAAASDTLTFYFASTATLTDNDVWITVNYPDGTNKHTWNRVSSRNSDPLASGTTLTTDSGSTWKDGASDLVGYNEYKIDVATSGDAGAKCVPIIYVNVNKASTTIYMCTSIGVS